jgi:hypothetical protein
MPPGGERSTSPTDRSAVFAGSCTTGGVDCREVAARKMCAIT